MAVAASNFGPLGRGLWGRSSWFGGPQDKTTGATTASGAPTSVPGIAVYNRNTLGGWWAVKIGNSVGIVKQTDLGPAPSTGRKFDYTYSLLPLFGFNTSTFPTGAQTYGYYLGNDLTNASVNLSNALSKLGADPKQQATIITAMDAGAVGKGGASAFVVGPGGSNPKTANNAGQPISPAPSGDATPVGPNLDVGSAITEIWSSLTTPALWKRVLYFIGGALLLGWGIKELTGAHVPAMAKRAIP